MVGPRACASNGCVRAAGLGTMPGDHTWRPAASLKLYNHRDFCLEGEAPLITIT